jgi:transcriptional regulator with XRE-family HTH domain
MVAPRVGGLERAAMENQVRIRRVKHKDGPDPIDVGVGLNLRRLRLARGISQAELAEALGITFQQIQKYERAANRVSASMLVKAARFLGVSPADLLPAEDEAGAPEAFSRRAAVSGSAEVLNAYAEMPNPDLRSAVLNMMRALGPRSSPARTAQRTAQGAAKAKKPG